MRLAGTIAALILAATLIGLYGCGHTYQATRVTVATIAAAEGVYARVAVARVAELRDRAKQECAAAPNRAACVDGVTAETFTALEKADSALRVYHIAERAAAACIAAGGDVATCTQAVIASAPAALQALAPFGIEVRP